MKKVLFTTIFLMTILLSCNNTVKKEAIVIQNKKILSYEVNLKRQHLKFYWKDTNNEIYKNFQNLKTSLNKHGKKLIFAVNGGMFNKDFSPQGLYIENGKTVNKLDTLKNGYGNFYMQPNGVFYITNTGNAFISESDNLPKHVYANIKYATQSGPMLMINGKMHSKFRKGSKNVHIRNGVGVLPNGNLLFAMSKEKINFYGFANYFKEKGCKNALYLDGFVSKTYLPFKNFTQLEGNFGVIIGIEEKIK